MLSCGLQFESIGKSAVVSRSRLMSRIVVVGAGVAGMTAALLAAEAGHAVTVLEREETIGGLARTFRYGGFAFDIGPHRFHTDDAAVRDFLNRILGADGDRIERRSGVWMFERYHDWPLRPASLLKLPLSVLLRTSGDILRRPRCRGESFRDYVLSRYGRTLYDVFFAPYTRKFVLADPEQIHRDWASAGIDRAVIDPRVRMNSLAEVVQTMLLPRPVKTEFIYPAQGGIGDFGERLAREIEQRHGAVRTGQRVVSVRREPGRIVSVSTDAATEYACDLLVWTAPVNELARMLGQDETGLGFVSTICYNCELEGEPRIPYQWCYFGQEQVSFNRVSFPTLFSRTMAPLGKCGVCAEVTCREGDSRWQEPAALQGRIEGELRRVGVVANADGINAIHIERIPNSYPVYRLGYHEELNRVRTELGVFANLRLLGRCGTFWYNNMDHSIRAALDLARELASGPLGN
jgi:protoporphyrinogen oxidase